MSQEDSNFKVPMAKINFQNIFAFDPDYTPKTNFRNSKLKINAKICRFTGVINQTLFGQIQEDLEYNLQEVYYKTIMKINRYTHMNLNDFDYMFNTFITFESF